MGLFDRLGDLGKCRGLLADARRELQIEREKREEVEAANRRQADAILRAVEPVVRERETFFRQCCENLLGEDDMSRFGWKGAWNTVVARYGKLEADLAADRRESKRYRDAHASVKGGLVEIRKQRDDAREECERLRERVASLDKQLEQQHANAADEHDRAEQAEARAEAAEDIVAQVIRVRRAERVLTAARASQDDERVDRAMRKVCAMAERLDEMLERHGAEVYLQMLTSHREALDEGE